MNYSDYALCSLHELYSVFLRPENVINFCHVNYLKIYLHIHFQCYDAVSWATGKASGLQKTEWWGAGMVICLRRGANLHMAQPMSLPLTISRSSKSGLVLPFRYRLTRVVPDEGVNGCRCLHKRREI